MKREGINTVVIGMQWGDEGKGKIVDLMAQESDLVCRYQGGANAGHTVLVGDREYVFHLVPSGILYPGKTCVIGNGVVLDPESLLSEIEYLHSQGIDPSGRLFVSENAHVTFPYHRMLDQAREEKRGSGQIGTTHRGIGPTYTDKGGRVGVRVIDLLDSELLADKLKRNLEQRNFEFVHYFGKSPVEFEPLHRAYLGYGEKLRPMIADTTLLVNKAIRQGKRVLFEGAQGTLLDMDFGTYPFVTASNPIAGGACTGAGVGPTVIDEVLGVLKAYTTRVGAGPFPTEFAPDLDEAMRLRGKEYGATTGRPRRCGWLDAVGLRLAVRVNGCTQLAVTKLDVLDELPILKICTGYKIAGKVRTEFPNNLRELRVAEPIYEELPGWQKDITNIRRREDLPPNCRTYLARIEEICGMPVTWASVGARREETIRCDGARVAVNA